MSLAHEHVRDRSSLARILSGDGSPELSSPFPPFVDVDEVAMHVARASRRPASKDKRTALKALNERLYTEGRFLHATKGFRKLKAKTLEAAQITQERRNGVHMNNLEIRARLERAERNGLRG